MCLIQYLCQHTWNRKSLSMEKDDDDDEDQIKNSNKDVLPLDDVSNAVNAQHKRD